MAFTQETFLGASISNFTASIGWTTEPSTLNVRLVEDAANGDVFSPPVVGNPVSFNYQGWIFNGLLKSYRASSGSDGSPIYDATLVDPREILEGVHLILNGYNGYVSAPNIINVYGYWENQSYGSAQVNQSGMPWYKVAQAVQNITYSAQAGNYGGPIRFINSTYRINILGLPNISHDYRIGADSITLMDFIIEVCEAGNFDFFVTMEEQGAGNFIIQINTVDRKNSQVLGGITTFLGSIEQYTQKNVGYEFLNNAVGKFLTGGQKEEIFLQVQSSGTIDKNDETYAEYSDDTIWPFWGFNSDGNAILGIGNFESDNHRFSLDSRLVNVQGVGAYYNTDVAEMRCALDSYESWEFLLVLKNRDTSSPHYQKATRLGIASVFGENIQDILDGTSNLDQLKGIDVYRMAALTKRQAGKFRHGEDDPHAENIMRLYDYVRSYASEFYGRKFMVRIPYVYIAQEPETDIIKLSQEPTDSGYVAEDEWSNAISNNILPSVVDYLTNEDGKIQAYVRFDNADNLDLSALSPDDYIFNDGFTSVFIKCTVNQGVCYLDKTNLVNPRAVIELPGPVRVLTGEGETNFTGMFNDLIHIVLETDLSNNGTSKFGYGGTDDQKQALIQNIATSWVDGVAGDMLHLGKPGVAKIPNLAAVPLKSNIDTYGPWYNYGLGGKMEYEKDETLVPWNYGGYDVMNAVAQAKIDEVLANQLISEAGSIEFPGVPAVQLGFALLDGGPNVTDVSVNITNGGATTTYTMQLSPKFGKFAKQNIDRLARLGKLSQKQRRAIRALQNTRPSNSKFFKDRSLPVKPLHKALHSSSTVIMSESRFGGNVEVSVGTSGIVSIPQYHIVTSIMPHYNALTQMQTNYHSKSLSSLDGLFVPFSTDPGENILQPSGIPRLAGSYIGEANPNSSINFLGTGWLATGTEIPESGLIKTARQTLVRPIALKAPLYLAGWGYDINDSPVPVAASGDPYNPSGVATEYPYGYQNRPDTWKVGPLDVRWDENRQVWRALGDSTPSGQLSTYVTRGYTSELIQPYETGFGELHNGTHVRMQSWLGEPVCEGQRVMLLSDNTQVSVVQDSVPSGFATSGSYPLYYIINSEFSQIDVVSNITCVSGQIVITKNTIFIPSAYSEVVTNLVVT